jgi:3-oxoacyl-[acyl-carrier-protein] synthase-3
MNYQHVCIESFGYTLPAERVTTAAIEQRLAPLYQRLRLPEGRLELMTGIRERRFFPAGTKPGDVSQQTAALAIEASEIAPERFGALIHGSVCRDYLEPATACRVHHAAGLPAKCVIYDLSNACLGVLNGMVQLANMIELGQIEAGVVVGSELGRPLVENTIAALNADLSLTRDSVKFAIASLTIGSASVAAVLCHERLSRTGNKLVAATAGCDTSHHALCQSDGLAELMHTDSEELLKAGVATGAMVFDDFLATSHWQRPDIDQTFCHQVGVAHRKLMFESLGLDTSIDYPTLAELGNTGSAALPITMALGAERGVIATHPGRPTRIAMLGIGSGVNSLMLAAEWNESKTAGQEWT